MQAEIIVAVVYTWVLILLIIAYLARRRIIFKAPPKEFLERYFLARRTLGGLVLGLSAALTAYSVGTFIGGIGFGYSFGYMWSYCYPMQGFLVLLILMMVGRKMAIVGRRINAITLLDVVKARFGTSVEIVAAISTIIFITAYILPQFFGGARALEAVTGFPYTQALVIFIILVTIYTVLGGFLGESWSDTIAAVIGGVIFLAYIAGLFVIAGGIEGIYRISKSLEGISLTLVKGSPILFNLALSMVVLIGVAAISLPHSTVRVLAYKDIKALKYGIIIGTVWSAIINIAMGLAGPIARILIPGLAVPDLANPMMVNMVFINPVLVGITIALVIGGGLTTIDSMFLIVSSSAVKNIAMAIKPDIRPEMSKKLSYIAVLACAALTIYLALYPPPLLEWAILYAVGGCVATYFAILTYGLYWRRANKYGALASLLGGVVTYIVFDLYFKPYLRGFHIVIPSFIVSNILMVVVSLLTPRPSREVINLFWGRRPLCTKS